MNPVAVLIGKGATPSQASAVIWGSVLAVAVPAGVWFVDKPVAQAVLIVIAISAPRAVFCLVAQWDGPARANCSRNPASGRRSAAGSDPPPVAGEAFEHGYARLLD